MTTNPVGAPATATAGGGPLDPFDGFFHNEPADLHDGLLDTPAARSWLRTVGWGARTGLYTFQQPLDERSGASVHVDGRTFVMASSYDYLGLVGHPDVEAASIEAVRRFGTGTGGVRLLTGTNTLHRDLEADLAAHYGVGAALTFSSGYLANLGAIAALFGPDDVAILDSRSHRSIADACRLARVPTRFFRHNDLAHLERVLAERPAGRTLIAVEGVYSMDGDGCDLAEVVRIKEKHAAYLLVDEAHALGAVGETGRGSWERDDVDPALVDIWTGSLSKSLASNGGFVAARPEVVYYLQHGAAPFFFSAALCPAAAAGAREALAVSGRETWRHRRLRRSADRMRDGLRALGWDSGSSTTPIIPVIAGADEAAYELARGLHDRGILATAVVHPAVPRGSARLRLCATAAHDDEAIDAILSAFASLSTSVDE